MRVSSRRAEPHRRQPLLARPLHRARRLHRPHPRRGAAACRPADLLRRRANEWESRSPPPARCQASAAHHAEAHERDASIDFLAFAPENPSIIRTCLETARAQRPGRAHGADRRDVGGDQRRLARAAALRRREDRPAEVARFLELGEGARRLRFDGSAYRTMLRNDAYCFSRLGVFLERADNTARILDVKYHVLLPRDRAASAAASTISSGRRSCARSRR